MGLLSSEEMKQKYGVFYESKGLVEINPENVPSNLRLLIPYAELWGISDDCYREQKIAESPHVALDDLVFAIKNHENLLDDWLAGDEADLDSPSDEYVCFSAMRMAADLI